MPKRTKSWKINYNDYHDLPMKNMSDKTRLRKEKEREEIRVSVLDFLQSRIEARVTKNDISRVNGILLKHVPKGMNSAVFFVRANQLYKKRYSINMKKVTVPCSCGLEHAILWQVMTPTEIQERVKVEQVKENNITISMTDMFFQKPLEPKWESFENMFWSGFRKLFKIR